MFGRPISVPVAVSSLCYAMKWTHSLLFLGKKSASHLSISSEESFESCASFPYSDDMLKSDGSRSATPSIQSDRLSRDGLDPYFTQIESSRSTNSLLEGPQDVRIPDNMSEENIMVSSFGLSGIVVKGGALLT